MRPLPVWLYLAAMLCATPAAAWTAADAASLEAARAGQMTRLVVHTEARPRVETAFFDAEGRERRFADGVGAVQVVNFWATWCPPCLKEMPSLDRLAKALEGGEAMVLAVSTDRGDPAKPMKWLADNGITSLAFHHDRGLRLASAAAILGQPTTLILDRAGREIARFQGEAEWDSDDALAVIRAAVEATRSGGGD
ncbi:TlpA disulfide reductase family protein [Rubrimonas sp.]|uniref:TlpA disulfide reductase family protein n=1 Tax=Rubrimonas sp. TaxID=2036015 RepID=UPI002FDD80BA